MNLLSLLCFMALVDDHGNHPWEAIFPIYLMEKMHVASLPPSIAFRALDNGNAMRVLAYCEKHGIETPQEWRDEWNERNDAYDALRKRFETNV